MARPALHPVEALLFAAWVALEAAAVLLVAGLALLLTITRWRPRHHPQPVDGSSPIRVMTPPRRASAAQAPPAAAAAPQHHRPAPAAAVTTRTAPAAITGHHGPMDDATRKHWEQIADETIDRAMKAGLAPLERDPDACMELGLDSNSSSSPMRLAQDHPNG